MAWWCKANRVEKITKPVKIKFTWFTFNEKEDCDNIAFAKKFILDGMVMAGVLQGDGRKWVRGLEDHFNISKKPRVEIEIYEI